MTQNVTSEVVYSADAFEEARARLLADLGPIDVAPAPIRTMIQNILDRNEDGRESVELFMRASVTVARMSQYRESRHQATLETLRSVGLIVIGSIVLAYLISLTR
jgi:hypothetical protein